MTGFYNYLEGIMPLKNIIISLTVGMVSLFIVLFSGLTSEFVRSETVASRTFSAFSFTTLASFIFLMSCEEYAIFKTKRELENFIDSAPIEATEEDFNRDEYLHIEAAEPEVEVELEPETEEDDTFRPMDFDSLQTQK